MFAYNSSIHSATGYQPYELLFGRKVEIPTSLTKPPEPQYNFTDYQFELKNKMQESHGIAKNRLISIKEKSKKTYDKKTHAKPLKVGDKVYLETKASHNKLTPKWIGPYEILGIAPNSVNITINYKVKNKIVHKNLLKHHSYSINSHFQKV